MQGAPPAPAQVLLSALATPAVLATLSVPEWDLLLRLARRARLLSRLAHVAQQLNLAEQLPQKVREHLAAASADAASCATNMRWEANRIRRALSDLGIPVLLLKGAAYVMADLPSARGRLASDIDIMVPEEALDEVQAALERQGWEPKDLDAYDQRYYRRWMHELPPLRHRQRGSVLDIHHTILPRTSRLRPDPAALWRAARQLPEQSFHVLSPEDMVLHSAAHLFHDGDLNVAVRDLADINDLLTCFGADPAFWPRLVPRAREIDLSRPLFYALRYAARILATPVPEEVAREAAADAPNRAVLALMDRLVPQVLLPPDPDDPGRGTGRAAKALYIRSHWLRMPPPLLAAHLTRKALKRWREKEKTED